MSYVIYTGSVYSLDQIFMTVQLGRMTCTEDYALGEVRNTCKEWKVLSKPRKMSVRSISITSYLEVKSIVTNEEFSKFLGNPRRKRVDDSRYCLLAWSWYRNCLPQISFRKWFLIEFFESLHPPCKPLQMIWYIDWRTITIVTQCLQYFCSQVRAYQMSLLSFDHWNRFNI